MGVYGLQGLMHNNPQMFVKSTLHDCSLVIDGNNVYHAIHLDSTGLDCVVGGDYVGYYAKVTEFFERLKLCNVVPYVVMDGSHTDDAHVLSSVLVRAKKRLSNLVRLSRGEQNVHRVLPLCAPRVFCDVMRDMAIPFVYSDFAADSQMVALANELRCPVLSADSDFYVYDVKGGFISWNNLVQDVQKKKSKDKTKQYKYLTAHVYFLERFLKGFGNGFQLNRMTFNLFAVLNQWHIIDGLNLSTLLRLMEQRNSENSLKLDCKLTLTGYKQRQMAEMLFGLRSVTRMEAFDAVVTSLSGHLRVEAKKALEKLLKDYTPTLTLDTKLLGLQKISSQVPNTLPSFTGKLLPSWFVDRCRSGNLIYLQITVLRWICLCNCVEKFTAQSVHGASLLLRRIIYGILLNCNQATGELRASVKEFSRRGEIIASEEVFPLYKLPNGTEIPHLESLPTMKLNVKRKFLAEVLLGDSTDSRGSLQTDVPDEWQMFVWTLVFWMRVTQKREKELWLVDSLLLCGLYYNALQGHLKVKSTTDKASVEAVKQKQQSTLRNSFEELLAADNQSKRRRCAKSQLFNFKKSVDFSYANPPDLDVIHAFVQFQTCLLNAEEINELLDRPVPSIRMSEFLNFVFLYNVCCHLKDHWSDREKLLSTWLGPVDGTDASNPIHAFFRDLRCLILGVPIAIGDDVAKKKKKEQRKQKSVENLRSAACAACSRSEVPVPVVTPAPLRVRTGGLGIVLGKGGNGRIPSAQTCTPVSLLENRFEALEELEGTEGQDRQDDSRAIEGC